MAQAYYDEDAGQAQLIREVVDTTTEPESVVDASKVVGKVNHDKLCDAVHEKVISSEVSTVGRPSSTTPSDDNIAAGPSRDGRRA